MQKTILRFISCTIMLLFVWLISTSFIVVSQEKSFTTEKTIPPFLKQNYPAVDSLIAIMSLEDKIAQMLMMPVYPEQGKTNLTQVKNWVTNNHIGGVIFFKGHPSTVKQWNKILQQDQDLPLMSAIDGEWGVSMRLDSCFAYPYAMTLGAIQNDSLLFLMGKQIGIECRAIGININFAPVVDVNTNPKNIIIGYRSFGADKKLVARKGYLYGLGLQTEGILAVAKHFPGHGDTEKDSHKTLPIVKHDSTRLFSTELYPFEQVFSLGLGGVMVAHLFVPAFEKQPNTAATLSHHIVTDILQDQLNYKGLIFTDALNMKGASAYWSDEELIQKAVLAGNDILLMPPDVEKTIQTVKKLVESGKISEAEIDKRVKKILKFKSWIKTQPRDTTSICNLQTPKSEKIQHQLYTQSTTMVKNENNVLPFIDLSNFNADLITIGKSKEAGNTFSEIFKKYYFIHDTALTFKQIETLKELPANLSHDTIVIGLIAPSKYPKNNYQIPVDVFSEIETLTKGKKVILIIFGSPYLLNGLVNTGSYTAILTTYQNNDLVQNIVAQQLFGALPISGTLPLTAGEFVVEEGISTQAIDRLRYETPELNGLNPDTLKLIDNIALEGIQQGAYPGCQVLVAKNGAVVYQKNFGYLTYDKKQPVTDNTIYDLASLTKPLATTMALMKLYGKKKFSLDDKLSKYLPVLDTTNKKGLFFEEVMTHQAGLNPWIPFYLKTIRDTALFDSIYDTHAHDQFQFPVANAMYMDTNYAHEIFRRIYDSDLKKKEYKYSDLGFYLLREIVEKMTKQPFDIYLKNKFYKPIGANFTGFNLWKEYPKQQFAPTEDDKTFRHQVVQGYVHDYGAAMLGGISGHAGLFSNANDLAKLLQMLLNGGNYGDKQYLDSVTINLFTSCPYCPDNRRGIGFDKPEKNPDKIGPTCDAAPKESYGHSGFTGTLVWNDPKNKIVYIFLSNRVYPDIENKKLLKLSTRTRIQDVIYRAIEH